MVRRGYSKFIKLIHFLGDVVILNITFLLTYLFYNEINPLFSFNDHYIFLLIAFNLLWLILVLIMQPYNIGRDIKLKSIVVGLLKEVSLHGLLIFAFLGCIRSYEYSRGHLLVTYVSLFFALVFWRILFVYLLQLYRRAGSNYRNVVIIGAGPLGMRLYHYFKADPSLGLRFLGFFEDNLEQHKRNEHILGTLEDLKEYSTKERIDEIFYSLPLTHTAKIMDLIKFADHNLIRFKIVPDFRSFLDKKFNIDFYNNIPVVTIRQEPMDNVFNIFLKRAFDIIFSGMVILLVFPWIFPFVMLMIKFTSKGPIFFKQKRTGKDNKVFYCLKFRTMYVNDEAHTLQAKANDPRITKIGRVLRDFSIDEMPQFFNVLKGDMTVVGPRPHMVKHTDEYSKVVDKFMVRHFVKPGITGLAQVKGYRGETENSHKMVKRVKHDLWYMENWSLYLDIKIIILTVFSIFKGNKNAV